MIIKSLILLHPPTTLTTRATTGTANTILALDLSFWNNNYNNHHGHNRKQGINGKRFFTSLSSSSSDAFSSDIMEHTIELPNGSFGQVFSAIPDNTNTNTNTNTIKNSKNTIITKPPLIFLHGSFHAAWCWTEQWFPFFVKHGYPVMAFSWRGTGGTPAAPGVTKVKASQHVEDLKGFLHQVPTLFQKHVQNNDNDNDNKNDDDHWTRRKPILLSHSFGGIVVMKYLEDICGYNHNHNNDDNTNNDITTSSSPRDLFLGMIFMCSVPPSGNGKMTMRYLKRSLKDSYKITIGFAMKKCCRDAKLCRLLFFGGGDGDDDDYGISNQDIQRYQDYFTRDTQATIDLIDLSKQLPIRLVDDKMTGCAPFVDMLPPCLVIGASNDFIVDREANMETAKYLGLNEPIYVDSPHDVMLGRNWNHGAETILNWIRETINQ